ncbi:MAG: tetratricopeptide repeat protein [Nitrospinota bacterium]
MSEPPRMPPGASPPGRTRRLLARAAAGALLWALASGGAALAPAQTFDLLAEHNRRALALVERGELEGAVAEWREARRVAPENVPVLHNLGIVLIKLGRLEEAEEALLEAVRLDYQNPKAHLLLGRAYLEQAKTQLAEAELATAQRLAPSDASVDIALADLAARRSQWRRAEGHLKRALTFKYNNPTAHAALGDVYRAMGNRSEAEQAYRAALRLDATHSGAKHGLRALERERRRPLASGEGGRSTGTLRVEDPTTRIERGRYVVEGQVVNTSERATAKHVTVVCRFFDTDERLIAEKETHPEPAHLGPGQRGRWRLSIPFTPKLASHFEIGAKAIIEDPEDARALHEATAREAGPSRESRRTFFGGDQVAPGDILKVSIPKPATQEGKLILRGYVVNVSDHPVASIDLIIGLVDRLTGRLQTQQFARIEAQILEPGERAGYSLELKEGLDLNRLRPTMKVSWADLSKAEAGPPGARSPQPEPPAPSPPSGDSLPTPLPQPLPSRPRN